MDVVGVDIRKEIGTAACLEQLAEEASELAQAALKYARIVRGENPTPVTMEEAAKKITEEYTDLAVCVARVSDLCYVDYRLYTDKYHRWQERIITRTNDPQDLQRL